MTEKKWNVYRTVIKIAQQAEDLEDYYMRLQKLRESQGDIAVYKYDQVRNPPVTVNVSMLVNNTDKMLDQFKRHEIYGKIGNTDLCPPISYDAYERGADLTNAVNNLEFTDNNVDIKSSGGEGGLL